MPELYRVTNNRAPPPDPRAPQGYPVFADGQWISVAPGEAQDLYLTPAVVASIADDAGIVCEPL